ncbi:hypothetical protein V8G54_018636 [Vigna mungo]|uniref:Chromo domain-containing protein n=1 Tax=Vigna mungo TaxID=3915 RepID=A0AAQ3NA84_VIGMU
MAVGFPLLWRRSNEDQGDEDELQNLASTIEDKVDFYMGVLLWYKEKKKTCYGAIEHQRGYYFGCDDPNDVYGFEVKTLMLEGQSVPLLSFNLDCCGDCSSILKSPISCASIPGDGGDVRSGCIEGLAEEYQNNAQANLHIKNKKGGKEVVCSNCLGGGVLLYHPYCVDPPLKYIPLRLWHCIWCTKKKIEFGVHSVSEGVKSILDSREVVSNNKVSSMLLVMQREYFVKYQGLAHAHNRWITESTMLLEAPKLLAKFKSEPKVSRWKSDWSIPHRLLLKREIVHFGGHGDNDSICCYEWLVKWTGLGYDNATWELQDASFLTSAKGRKLIRDYESRRKGVDKLSKSHFEDNETMSGLPQSLFHEATKTRWEKVYVRKKNPRAEMGFWLREERNCFCVALERSVALDRFLLVNATKEKGQVKTGELKNTVAMDARMELSCHGGDMILSNSKPINDQDNANQLKLVELMICSWEKIPHVDGENSIRPKMESSSGGSGLKSLEGEALDCLKLLIGASHNFISRRLVEAIGWQWETNKNGHRSKTLGVCCKIKIEIKGCDFMVDAYLFDLEDINMIWACHGLFLWAKWLLIGENKP